MTGIGDGGGGWGARWRRGRGAAARRGGGRRGRRWVAGVGGGGVVWGARSRRGAVALLLAVAVLLCHGLYGASHQAHRFGPEAPGHGASHGTQPHGARA